MLLITFIAISLIGGILPAYLLGLHRYLRWYAAISFIELLIFWAASGAAFIGGPYRRTIFGNIYLNGASADLLGMMGLLLVWVIISFSEGVVGDSLILREHDLTFANRTARQTANYFIALLSVLILGGGANFMSFVVFLESIDPSTSTIWRRKSPLLIVASTIVTMITVVFWGYFTYFTPNPGTLEVLWQAFNENEVTMHIFYTIFLGSWFVWPIIIHLPGFDKSTRPPWLAVVMEWTYKCLLIVIGLLCLTVAYWIIWLIAMYTPPPRTKSASRTS